MLTTKPTTKPVLTAKDLTRGERLLLSRRREGMTKAQAAALRGVSLYRYTRWEADMDGDEPAMRMGRLTQPEVFHVLRRRAGLRVADLAALAGVSAWWATQVESGAEVSPERLAAFWASCRWSPRVAARKAARARLRG